MPAEETEELEEYNENFDYDMPIEDFPEPANDTPMSSSTSYDRKRGIGDGIKQRVSEMEKNGTSKPVIPKIGTAGLSKSVAGSGAAISNGNIGGAMALGKGAANTMSKALTGGVTGKTAAAANAAKGLSQVIGKQSLSPKGILNDRKLGASNQQKTNPIKDLAKAGLKHVALMIVTNPVFWAILGGILLITIVVGLVMSIWGMFFSGGDTVITQDDSASFIPTVNLAGMPTNEDDGETVGWGDILFLGDSLGCGIETCGLFERDLPDTSGRIENKVEGTAMSEIILPNAIVHVYGGMSLSWGLEKLNNEYKSTTKKIVVIELGSNDCGPNRESILNQMLNLLSDKQVILVTTNIPDTDEYKYGDEHNQLYKSVASTHNNVHIADWSTEGDKDRQAYFGSGGDGIHLTNKGYEALWECIKGAIKPLLKSGKGSAFTGDWTYYNQLDPNWDSPDSKIGWGSACGVVSAAMVLVSYSGDEQYNPNFVANDLCNRSNAVYSANICDFVNSHPEVFHLKATVIKDFRTDENWARIKAACEAGGCAEIYTTEYPITSDKHWVVVREVKDGKIYIADPSAWGGTKAEYEIDGQEGTGVHAESLVVNGGIPGTPSCMLFEKI